MPHNKMKNIYRDSEGKAPSQFKGEAEGFDMCLKMLKEKGVYIPCPPWECNHHYLLMAVLPKLFKPCHLICIEDDSK